MWLLQVLSSHRNLSTPPLGRGLLPLAPGEVVIPLGLEGAGGEPCSKQEDTGKRQAGEGSRLALEQTEQGLAYWDSLPCLTGPCCLYLGVLWRLNGDAWLDASSHSSASSPLRPLKKLPTIAVGLSPLCGKGFVQLFLDFSFFVSRKF